MVDQVAKEAAQPDTTYPTIHTVPFSRMCLRSAIRRHYSAQLQRHTPYEASTLRCSSSESDLFHAMPHFDNSISWTSTHSRHETALIAQFLTGHFPSGQYLTPFTTVTLLSALHAGVPSMIVTIAFLYALPSTLSMAV